MTFSTGATHSVHMASPFARELLEDMTDVRDAGLTPDQFTAIRRDPT